MLKKEYKKTNDVPKNSVSTGIVVPGKNSIWLHQLDICTQDLILQYPGVDEVILKKVLQAIDCLLEVFHLFGLRRHTDMCDLEKGKYRDQRDKAAKRALDYIVSSNEKNNWVAYFKYKICAFYAHFEKQDLPPRPKELTEKDKPNVIFGGYILGWQKTLSTTEDWDSFIITILQSKMGMPRATSDMIKDAENKMIETLTRDIYLCPTCGRDTLNDHLCEGSKHLEYSRRHGRIKLDRMTFKQQLKRTVIELFADSVYTKEDHYEPFFPSTSANYNRSRTKGGAAVTIQELISIISDPVDYDGLVKREIKQTTVSGEISQSYGDKRIEEQQVLDEDQGLRVVDGFHFDAANLKMRWKEVIDMIGYLAANEQPIVEPVGLAEALKIRVISKGPEFTYTFLSPFQKFMWRTLKKNRVFKLISETITPEHIQERIGLPEKDEIIINGDYKASTDNLHSWVSEEIVNTLIDILQLNAVDRERLTEDRFDITEQFREIVLRSLTGHVFINKDKEKKKQTEGQLMGSVTSFPILCIANAAMCRWALELSNNREYRLSDSPTTSFGPIAPLLINGDDCSLKGKRQKFPWDPETGLRSYWEDITSFGGLQTSIGKTVFSVPEKPIAVLNSRTYHLKNGRWVEIPFINMGIINGMQRSSATDSEKRSFHQLGALHRELKLRSPPRQWSGVSESFIRNHRDILNECQNIPWDMPEYLGGPGLIRKESYSELNKRCATLLIIKSNDKKYQIKKPVLDPQWKVHELVSKKIQGDIPDNYRFAYNPVENLEDFDLFYDQFDDQEDNETSFSKMYKYMCVSTLFSHLNLFQVERNNGRKNVAVSILHKENRRRLNHNMSVWSKVTRECFLCDFKAREDHEIDYLKIPGAPVTLDRSANLLINSQSVLTY